MWLIDRYIVRRFLANFFILFFLLFVFAASIDLLTQLDEFVEGARAVAGPDAGVLKLLTSLVGVIVNFHGPRLFQFYAYMLGLLSVGAMGFTLAHMHRHRELVAILASGVRLHRVAMPIMITALGLNVLQLLNQEFMLPRMAPLLIRGHGDIGKKGAEAYEIRFTADSRGNLLQAPSFDPSTNTLQWPTFLERDEAGRTLRRITADAATWDEAVQIWTLRNGRAVSPSDSGGGSTAMLAGQPVESFATDLRPDVLKIRRFREYATMLSLRQINEILQSPGVVDQGALVRFALARFSTVLINIMVLAMALPFYLLREPANLLRKSLFCAATTVPAMMGALLGFAVALPGVPASVSVFLPVVVLLPVTMYVVSLIRS